MKPASRVILTAGLIAGALDILYVIIIYGVRGVPATRILQGIAAGLLGSAAAGKGGVATAGLGLALHFVIAVGAAAAFYAVSRRLRFLVEYPVIGGLLFGGAVWLFMNLIVLPLSANPPRSFPPPQWGTVFVAHLLCVGLPIALVVRREIGK
ncbi:MAG TPA: hypothetical protein VM029_14190 [Opitutaceae bacterium]|nr:hypothetical protein [Opitutaceae bacterium]